MIEKKEFIKILEEEFQEEDKNCQLVEETSYKTVAAWSSMLALLVIVKITEMYDVILDEEDIRSTETVNDLYNVVVANQKKITIGNS